MILRTARFLCVIYAEICVNPTPVLMIWFFAPAVSRRYPSTTKMATWRTERYVQPFWITHKIYLTGPRSRDSPILRWRHRRIPAFFAPTKDHGFRLEVMNDKSHVTWNAERRCFISAEAGTRWDVSTNARYGTALGETFPQTHGTVRYGASYRTQRSCCFSKSVVLPRLIHKRADRVQRLRRAPWKVLEI